MESNLSKILLATGLGLLTALCAVLSTQYLRLNWCLLVSGRGSPKTRANACYALVRTRRPVPLDRVIAILLTDQNKSVRMIAAMALRHAEIRKTKVADALAKALTHDSTTGVRISCAHSLAELGVRTPAVLRSLRAALRSSDKELREAAEKALQVLERLEPCAPEK